MPLIQWTEALSVGVRELDDQHRQMLSMINELHTALLERRGKDVASDMVERLKDYVRKHFTAEERLMERHGYPDLAAHRAEHNQFIEKVLDFDLECNDGGNLSPMQIQGFLRSWLTSHIKGTDQLYGPFLNERGVR